jgi:S-adenosylmethionine:tRNA ribosyltransferase-isomerase
VDVPDYDLPPEAIAQHPADPRDSARLLDAIDGAGTVVHRRVSELPELLGPGDVLVVNSSRVIPARLRLFKQTGGTAEVLLLAPSDPDGHLGPGRPDPSGRPAQDWTALVRPGRRLPPGTVLSAQPGGPGAVEVLDRLADGVRKVRFLADAAAVVASCGRLALPPYIRVPPADSERYQTVYADRAGSVAAPTAGLHLTKAVLERCRQRGVVVKAVDLAVGLATFRPVVADRAEEHVMHREGYRVPADTWAACQRARRVVAVGTTTVRALETVALTGEMEGSSGLFIRGGFDFQVVDVLMTNYHQPRSTLLLMLESFAGPRWRDLYDMALGCGYRFLSFGDCMIVGRG